MNPTHLAALDNLKREIAGMRRSKQNERFKPHKFLLLLAVLDLAEDELLPENKIAFDALLWERFNRRFNFGADESDWAQVGTPFFHLRSSSFWHHKIKAGREEHYAKITTAGGGKKRILENIEYATLSPEVFNLVNDPEARHNLRSFLIALFPPESAKSLETMTKLGTAFHETFRLSRSSLSQIMQVVSDATGSLTLEDFKDQTTLGNNQIKSTRRYAYGAGLLDDNEQLTPFGSICKERDLEIAKPDSQWIIHYNLAVEHGAGPRFWNALFQERLPKQISRVELAEMIKGFDAGNLASGTYLGAATVFAGTYCESDSLGQLGFLEEQGSNSGQYVVSEPVPISAGAFACVLADYWGGVWSERENVLLTEVTQGPLSRLLRAEGTLGENLRALEKRGLVRLQRRTSPFSVTRLWSDERALWREQLYSN